MVMVRDGFGLPKLIRCFAIVRTSPSHAARVGRSTTTHLPLAPECTSLQIEPVVPFLVNH